MVILTAITSGLTPRYFPFPHPTSASTLPGGSEDRKWQTRDQGVWRVLLKWEAMASYTRCTYSSSRWAASAWQLGSDGGDGGEAEGPPWLSQAEGKAGEGETERVRWRGALHSAEAPRCLTWWECSRLLQDVNILTTAAGFMSDLAESEGSAGAPLAQSEIAVGPEVRHCMSRELWVTSRHHVKLPRSNPERR